MNEIIVQTLPTMTSREIAQLTEKEHKHVMRDIDTMFEALEIDPLGYVQRWTHPQNGQSYRIYALPEELTLTLVAGYNAKIRLRIIQRWKELESRNAEPAFALPKTFAEALRLAADQQETIQQQAEALAIAAPKSEFFDKYANAGSGSKKFREVCKSLNVKESKFWEFLKEKSIMYRLRKKQMPYQNHIDAGRFEIKTGVTDEGHAFNTVLFTPKGITWIAGEWGKYQLELKEKK